MTEHSSVVAWGEGRGGAGRIKKGQKETSVGNEMFITLNVMLVSQM